MILRRGYEFAPGYRLQAYIGKGQFGEVWRATGPGGVTLAAKFINLEDGSGQKEYSAIKRIKSIRHANLMQITGIWQLDYEGVVLPEPPDETEVTFNALDLDSQDTTGFVVNPGPMASLLVVGMLLGDASLEKYVPRPNDPSPPAPVAPGDLLRYMEGVARGLDFLNAPRHDFGAGLVSLQHCDIKPANIVLIGDSAVICDFGLARVLKRNEATMTSAAGTPAYMSPEAINGKPSCNSDQYSLAVTYYHLRTGKLPLDEGSIHKVLQTHLSGTLQFDRVPAIEREILQRATHKQWRERYPSNSAFVDAIRVALTQQGLNNVGVGAGPTARAAKPEPSAQTPNGPAVLGLDTLDSEDLTDAFVKRSKGGSPMLSGPSPESREAGGSLSGMGPPNQIRAEELDQTEPISDTFDFGSAVEPARDSVNAIVPNLLAGQGSANAARGNSPATDNTRYTRQDGRGRFWRKSAWMIATGIAGVAVSALLIPLSGLWSEPRTGDDKGTGVPPVVSDDAATLMAQAVASLAIESPTTQQRQDAIQQYRSATQADPSLLQVRPVLSLDKHAGAVEVLLPVGSPNRYLTTGYDQDIRLWTSDSPDSSLSSIVLAKAPTQIVYDENTKLSSDRKRLFVGASLQITAWDLAQWQTIDKDAFPLTAAASWLLPAEVLALAVHPTKSNQVVAALDDRSAVVIDTNVKTTASDNGSNPAVIAQTDMSDFGTQLRYVASGDQLLVRYEGGVVVLYDWEEFATNDRSRSAAKAIQTGIASARIVDVPSPNTVRSGLAADLFFAGDDRGVVSVYQVFGEETKVERVLVDDDAHDQGITQLASAWMNPTTMILASGNDQGSVALQVFEPHESTGLAEAATELTKRPATVLRLSTEPQSDVGSPVRCLAFSRDGKWLTAGVGDEVWVVSVSLPQPELAVFPIADVLVDTLLIDEDNDRLMVGCENGTLAALDWSHCRLRAIAGPVRAGELPSISVPKAPAPKDRYTAL